MPVSRKYVFQHVLYKGKKIKTFSVWTEQVASVIKTKTVKKKKNTESTLDEGHRMNRPKHCVGKLKHTKKDTVRQKNISIKYMTSKDN